MNYIHSNCFQYIRYPRLVILKVNRKKYPVNVGQKKVVEI